MKLTAMRNSITFDGLTLSYLEKNETSPHTIFFIHGNSASATFWQPQLDDAALSAYRLVAFDLPAHGHSSADPANNYGVMDIGKTMAKAVRQLAEDNPYILVAISMGTNILAEMLEETIHPAGIVLAGPTIIGDDYSLQNIGLPCLDPTVIFTDGASEDEVYRYYGEVLYTKDVDLVGTLAADYLNVKLPFRSTMIGKAMQGQISNELELLRGKGVPLLIVFGQEERSVNPHYLDEANLPKWKEKVHKLPSAAHLVSLEQPQAFNELLQAYAGERFTGSPSSAHNV